VVNESRNGKVVAFWVDKGLLKKINKLVETKKIENRSAVINLALKEFFKKNKKE